MKVKICGITNLKDALHAAISGADALGFVFYEPSPRYIEPKRAKEIVELLPPFVESVGLFVNATKESIERTVRECKLSRAQLHFEVDESFLDAIEVPVLPVVRAKAREDILRFEPRYRLVDAYVQGYGGEGKRLVPEWFKDRDNSKLIIAGGLTPQNITELQDFGFWGVDVSSGVEMGPGKKDPKKVEAFIKHAKALY